MLCSTLIFFIVFFCWLEYPYFLFREPISLSTRIDTVPFGNSSLATLTRDHFWVSLMHPASGWLNSLSALNHPVCMLFLSHVGSYAPYWQELICLLWLLISHSSLHVFKCAKHPWKGRGQMIRCSGNNMNFGVIFTVRLYHLPLLVWHM